MIELIKYLLCTAGGVAIGYYFAHGRLEQEFQERLDRETDEARDFYRRKYMDKAKEEGEDKDLTQAAIDAAEALEKYSGVMVSPSILTEEMSATVQRAVERGDLTVSEDPTDEILDGIERAEKPTDPISGDGSNIVGVKGIFQQEKINYNRISTPPKSETPKDPDTDTTKVTEAAEPEPEIQVDAITRQAFIDNEFEYEQFSLTYFAGDDVLVNEEDEPMKGNRVHMLGSEAATKIKVGREAMGGSDTIYVRNHTGKWEFEVTRSEGKFSDEVGAESG